MQLEQRGSDRFVDQRAEFPFSSDDELIAHQRFFEDTLVRALRKLLEGGYWLRYPIAHLVRFDGELGEEAKDLIRQSFREAGIEDIIFAVEDLSDAEIA